MSIHTDDFALPPGAPAPRLVSAAPASPREEALERALRPKLLDEYVGQAKAREQLEIFIGAAKKRGDAGAADTRRGPGAPGGRAKSSVWMLMLRVDRPRPAHRPRQRQAPQRRSSD